MSNEKEVVPAHPLGEVQIAGHQTAESATSLDSFAGEIHAKWLPQAAVSSLLAGHGRYTHSNVIRGDERIGQIFRKEDWWMRGNHGKGETRDCR